MSDSDAPSLEVGFLIDTGDSFGELARLQQVMDSTEGQLLQKAAAIERATGGMMNLGGATASLTTFGITGDKAFDMTARAAKRAEDAGERLSAQLERQISTFGKTRAELRALNAEQAALNATAAGHTELAGRITSQQATIAEMERLAQVAKAAALEEDRLAAATRALKASVDPLAVAEDKLNQELAQAQVLYERGKISAVEYGNANTVLAGRLAEVKLQQAQAANGMRSATGASGNMKAGMQQLSFQLNDVATMFSLGARPMQIFASQSGQVIQAVQMMSSGTGGLIGLLGGPWGMVLTSAIVVLSPFVAKLFEGAEGSKQHEEALKAQQKAIEDLDTATGHGNMTLQQRIAIDANAARAALNTAQATREATRAEIQRMLAIANAPVGVSPRGEGLNAGAALAQDQARGAAAALEVQLKATNAEIAKNEERLRAVARSGLHEQITAITDKNAAATKRLTDARTLLDQAYDKGRVSDADYVRRGAEIERQLKAVSGADKAAAAAKREHTKEIREQIKAQKELQSTYDSIIGRLDPMTAATREYEKALADIEKLLKAGMLGKGDLGEQYAAQLRAAAREVEARAKGAFVELKIEPITIDMDKIKRELAQITGFDPEAMDRMRNVFRDAAFDFADIVGGKFGRIIGQLASVLDRFAPGVTAALGKMFQEVDKQLGGLLKFGGIGGIAAQATGGSGLGGSIGGAIGGKLGEKFLEKGMTDLFGKTLGSFAGPLGAIAGGLLGGVIGGLLKSTPKASATVSIMAGDAMMSSLAGNSSKLKAVASGLADSLIGGISSIADQLGGLLGDGIQISIGQRKKTFRVDVEGLGRTKYMPSFATEQEAVEFALQQAIMRGAVTGLRAGTDTLLKGAGDLQAQLQKALSFEGVFKELKQRTDPIGFALEELGKEYDKLRKIFDEAGASAADYAQLEELFAIKRQDAMAQAEKAVEAVNPALAERAGLERQLLEVQGDTAAIRALELAALDESNRALQERIWSLQDEAVAAQEATRAAEALAAQQRAVAQERAGLERQLLELNGNTAALRELDLANIDESNRDLLREIYARQDAIAAEAAAQAAAQAAAVEAARLAEQQQRALEEAARAAQQLVDAWAQIGDTIMDEVRRIRGDMLTEQQSYAQLVGQFNAATEAARLGSQDAAKTLPELSRAMLEAAEATATDSLMLKRIQDVTAASLEQTYGVIAAAMGLGGTGTVETQDQQVQRFADGVQASNASTGAANDTALEIRALRAEVAQLRTENNAKNDQIIDKTERTTKVLERAQAFGGDGNSLAVIEAA